jgi:hypothetical protein
MRSHGTLFAVSARLTTIGEIRVITKPLMAIVITIVFAIAGMALSALAAQYADKHEPFTDDPDEDRFWY